MSSLRTARSVSAAEVPAKIVEVLAKNNDAVSAGDLLVRLDSDDLDSKLVSAQAEALVREREREDEPVKGLALERRQAEDTETASERALFAARTALDEAYRKSKAGQGDANALNKAREDLKKAEDKLAADRVALAKVNAKPDMPLPTRLESSLTQARMDVAQIENAIDEDARPCALERNRSQRMGEGRRDRRTLGGRAAHSVRRSFQPARSRRGRGARRAQNPRRSARRRPRRCLSRRRISRAW